MNNIYDNSKTLAIEINKIMGSKKPFFGKFDDTSPYVAAMAFVLLPTIIEEAEANGDKFIKDYTSPLNEKRFSIVLRMQEDVSEDKPHLYLVETYEKENRTETDDVKDLEAAYALIAKKVAIDMEAFNIMQCELIAPSENSPDESQGLAHNKKPERHRVVQALILFP